MFDIQSIEKLKITSLEPSLRRDLIEFCSSLEPSEYPEASLITKGKSKTLVGFVKIYNKLINKKQKLDKKRLKQAEKMIMNLHDLRHAQVTPHRQEPVEIVTARFIDRGPVIESQSSQLIKRLNTESIKAISDKIQRGQALSLEEAIGFAQARYAEFIGSLPEKDLQTPSPLNHSRPVATIVMCSDARNILGRIVLDKKISVESRAGNEVVPLAVDTNAIFVLGHEGCGGCGAVNAARHFHEESSPPSDQSIAAITVDKIPRFVATIKDADLASRENVHYQVEQFRSLYPDKKVYGIISNVQTKSAKLIAGSNDDLSRSIVSSINSALHENADKDLSIQNAGFIVATRSGRALPGKIILSLEANEGFEVNFNVDHSDSVTVPLEAEGSAKYARTNVGSVKKSKIILVTDPDADVAQKAADQYRLLIPDAFVVAMQELPQTGDLNLIGELDRLVKEHHKLLHPQSER